MVCVCVCVCKTGSTSTSTVAYHTPLNAEKIYIDTIDHRDETTERERERESVSIPTKNGKKTDEDG